MLAAVFRGAGRIELAELADPVPGAGEVLLRVKACGICGSDVGAYKTGMYEPGIVIGHEIVAEVMEVGPEVEGWAPGDRVTVNGVIPCGRCYFCRHGRPSLCEEVLMPGVNMNGGMATHMKAPAKGLHRLPDSVDDLTGCLVDPLSNVLHGIRRSRFRPGDRALVLGGGPIGLLTVQCLKLAGARAVYLSEPSPTRRRAGEFAGADAVFDPLAENLYLRIDELTGGEGVDFVFECAGAPATLREAPMLVRKGGQVVVLGICEEPVESDFMTVVLNEVEIVGSYCGPEEYPAAITYLARGQVNPRAIISHVIPLEELVPKGFEALAAPAPEPVKVVVEMPAR